MSSSSAQSSSSSLLSSSSATSSSSHGTMSSSAESSSSSSPGAQSPSSQLFSTQLKSSSQVPLPNLPSSETKLPSQSSTGGGWMDKAVPGSTNSDTRQTAHERTIDDIDMGILLLEPDPEHHS
ncbi:MAG: hypothetical protein CL928_08575 [Deltaproteobacteria bacterium]|nr:hypothetical protein [Deltaproteobacteria bacterium]